MKTNPRSRAKSARDPVPTQLKEPPAIKVQFTLDNPHPREVFLAGDFNHWNPTELPLTRARDAAAWTTEVALPPGAHEYRFVVDGHWETDPTADSVPNPFGSRNSIVHVATPQVSPREATNACSLNPKPVSALSGHKRARPTRKWK